MEEETAPEPVENPVENTEPQRQAYPAPKRNRLSIFEKILLVLGGIVVLFTLYVTLDANKYTAEVRVVEGQGRVGINPTTERLDFGDLSPGASAVRTVKVVNGTVIPMYVFTLRFGNITDLMDQNKNFFVLPARSEETIEWSVYMPASAPLGEKITGRVFLFKIPGPWKK